MSPTGPDLHEGAGLDHDPLFRSECAGVCIAEMALNTYCLHVRTLTESQAA